MSYIPAIFAFLVAAAGWFYLWHSDAAAALKGLEEAPLNRLRIRLRRIGGAAMLLLALCFYLGYIFVTQRRNAVLALCCLLGVGVLLVMVLVLATIDVRLTRRLKQQQRRLDQ